jgi:hypothetical protein
VRYEHKYLVPMGQIDRLRKRVAPFLRLDRFASNSPLGMYTVRSIYYDSPNFEMYYTKVNHLANRLKVRVRGYNVGSTETPVFMELKRKYEAPIQKNRAFLPLNVLQSLLNGGNFEDHLNEIQNHDNARRFLYQVLSKNMRPVVNVIYEREPFSSKIFDPVNDFRLTLDLNLRGVPYPALADLYKEDGARYVHPGFFIMEVKFNQYCPAWVKPILEELMLYKEPASKYVGCIDVNPIIIPQRRFDLMAKSRY